MKLKILILAAVVATAGLVSCGGGYRATDSSTVSVEVPVGTERAFLDQYPGATNVVWLRYDQVPAPIDWELAEWTPMGERDYVVRFNLNNEDYYGWYDADGNWIGTAYVVTDYKTLPASISATINSQFPGYAITSAHKEFRKDKMLYEVVLKNSSDSRVKLLVDSNGTIVRQKNR